MAPKYRTKNSVKIVDLLQDLRISEGKLHAILRELNIRTEEGQKNLDQNEVGKVRRYLNEQKRREELRGQTITIPSIVKIQELSKRLELPIGNVLGTLLKNGVIANINDDLDYDTAAIVAQELGYNTQEDVGELEKDVLTPEKLDEILKKEDPAQQTPRPPVVTIMGHVDHGKTTLLDTIRSANVAGEEAGGITQAISSYQVQHNGRPITFIDTPGHETFEFMRKRGASLADLAILVVAADDGVKPQTKEAVKYARQAGVPILVAINKIDRPQANVEKVKKELGELDLLSEDWGGKTTIVEISALKNIGIDTLLEMILLTTDISAPKAIVDRPALGSVVESRLDKNVGPLAAVLIHTGTLREGDNVVIGRVVGRVRRLLDFRAKQVKEAGPSVPVTIVGLQDIPQAGDIMQVVEAGGEAREKASLRRAPVKTLTKSDEGDERPTLAIILKADSKGSLEALQQTITAMVPEQVRLSVIRAEVGNVSDSDVLTAKAAGAIIYAFNAAVAGMSKKLADKEKVQIKHFKIIYQLAEDFRQVVEERMPMDTIRVDLGRLKVLKVFFSTPRKKIVGGEVAQGVIEKDARIIIWRKDKASPEPEQIGQGTIVELQREKRPIPKAEQGDQVGMTIEGKGKIKEGDVLEVYKEEKVRRGSVDSQE